MKKNIKQQLVEVCCLALYNRQQSTGKIGLNLEDIEGPVLQSHLTHYWAESFDRYLKLPLLQINFSFRLILCECALCLFWGALIRRTLWLHLICPFDFVSSYRWMDAFLVVAA